MIQFRVARLFGLRVEADGILIPQAAGLQLVFSQPGERRGLLEVQTESVQIPWSELEKWEVDYGLLNDRVSLTVASLESLRNLPGVKERHVELLVHKQQRDALKQFERRAKEFESGQREENVDEMIDEIRDFLQDL